MFNIVKTDLLLKTIIVLLIIAITIILIKQINTL